MSGVGPIWGKDGLGTRLAVTLVALLPLNAALAALIQQQGGSFSGGFGGLVGGLGAFIGVRYRFREYWTLPAAHRASVKRATRTGETTGIPQLDEIALRLLTERAQHYELMRVLGAVLALAAASLPVIAAILISPMWLLADLPFSALLLYLSVCEDRDPRPVLRSLTEARSNRYG